MSDHDFSIGGTPGFTGYQSDEASFSRALERAQYQPQTGGASQLVEGQGSCMPDDLGLWGRRPRTDRSEGPGPCLPDKFNIWDLLGFGRKRSARTEMCETRAAPEAWPPKGSAPYTGAPIYFPNEVDMVPYEHLAEMPDGRVFYRSNGRETLGALVTMAAPFNPGGVRDRTRFVNQNQLPMMHADNARPFKDGDQVLFRPARPQLAPATKAADKPQFKVEASPVDHDTYYADQIDKQVISTAMGTVKAEAGSWNPSSSAKAAEALLESRFGKSYVDTMKQTWAAEQHAAMLKRQGTIDLPIEERTAQARARFMQKLDEDFGAFSPVMKFFLPTYAMPELGLAPSPIEIVTDIGSGVHFSTGGRGLQSYRRGSQEMTRVNSNDGHSYFVTESSHLRTVKPAKPEQFTEIKTTSGQTVWVSPAAPKVSTKTADKVTAWVDPAVKGSQAKSSNGSGVTAPPVSQGQKPVNGAQPPAAKRDKVPGKAAQAGDNTSTPGSAGQGASSRPNTETQPKPAVMTADGTVKTVDPAKSGQANGSPGTTKPPVDGSGKVTLDNALYPGDPAHKGFETLKQLVHAPNDDARALRIFERERDGEGVNRSMVEQEKIIFSANGYLPQDKLRQAFPGAKIEVQTSGKAIVYEVTVPYAAAKTGATGGPVRLVDPHKELSIMAQEITWLTFDWHTVDAASTPRGRVRYPTHAADPLKDQTPIGGVNGWNYHVQFAQARSVAAQALEAANAKGAAYYQSPETMMRTLDDMHRAQMGTNPLYDGVRPGEMRHPDRLFFGPSLTSHMVDLAKISKRYGESYRLDGPNLPRTQDIFASGHAQNLKMTPALSEAVWKQYNPGLPYDKKLVNPWYLDGVSYQYAGTKTVKADHPDYARQLQYEKAVVETYQRIAWEKGREAMDILKQRNDVNPAENAQKFQQLDNEFMAKLGEHTYFLMNTRKYDNGNASIYMNEVNMLLRMGGYNEVPHGLLDHAAYRFSPENFSRHFTDWVRENN